MQFCFKYDILQVVESSIFKGDDYLGKPSDLSGQRFGNLVAISLNEEAKRDDHCYWNCICDCGNSCVVRSTCLKSGHTTTCGYCGGVRHSGNRDGIYNRKKQKRKYIPVKREKEHKSSSKTNNTHIEYKHESKEKIGKNEYRIEGSTVYVTLSNCNDEMICDLDDWEQCKKYTWHKDDKGYPSNANKKRFHRLILPKKDGKVLDHINRNKLDNRKSNLRYVNFSINIANRESLAGKPSYMIGVYSTENGKWKARIGYKRKVYHLGTFDNVEDAILARKEAEIKFYGTEI